MMRSYEAAPGIDVLASDFGVPGFGLLPINAFLLTGSEPLLVDTGAVVESTEFMALLRSMIDPSELRWIWLTHTDFDHIGSLHQLLDENPRIRVITTFLGVGIMSVSAPLPLERVNFVNPGEKITVGDRTLTAVKPPTFDNPSTTGFHDDSSGAFFSADCFGAILQSIPQSAAALSEQDLRQGQVFWATVDSPWLHMVDRDMFAKSLQGVLEAEPTMILSSHLPAASGDMTEQLLATLATVPAAVPFAGPDQAALEQMLRQMRLGSQS